MGKVSVLIRPFRYFTRIFDSNKEPEMQIGLPTEVKHVAHIGWDGPNVNNPNWMKDYHSAPLSSMPGGEDGRESPATFMGGSQEMARKGIGGSPAARESPSESPDRQNPTSTKKKHSRRPQSEGNIPCDSVAAEGTRRSRKTKKKEASADSSSHPAIPKKSHRRRSKTSSKSKAAAAALDAETEDSGARPSQAVKRTAE